MSEITTDAMGGVYRIQDTYFHVYLYIMLTAQSIPGYQFNISNPWREGTIIVVPSIIELSGRNRLTFISSHLATVLLDRPPSLHKGLVELSIALEIA